MSNTGVLNRSSHIFQPVASRGLVDGALDVLVQVVDEFLGLVDVESNVVIWNSDFSMEESHIGCVATDGVEDDFLFFEIVRPSV